MFKIKFHKARFVAVAYLTIIIQATFMHCIALGTVKPDLVLLLVIFFSLYNGSQAGLICGLIVGFCVDVLSSGIVGINCFILGGAGLLCGFLKERVYAGHLLTRILVGFAACLFSVISYNILALHFYRLPPFFENGAVIAGTIIYTTLFNIVFFKILEKTIVSKVTRLI